VCFQCMCVVLTHYQKFARSWQNGRSLCANLHMNHA
jgi:hypothetical protein